MMSINPYDYIEQLVRRAWYKIYLDILVEEGKITMSYLHVDRNSLISDLRQNVIEVRFMKLDGNVRIMKATLHSSYLPEDTRSREQITEAANRERRNDVVTLWDTDAGGWRSIKLDSIISLQLMPSG